MQQGVNHQAECHNPTGPAQYIHVAELLKKVAESKAKTHRLPTSEFVYPGGQCQAMRDGTVIYRDSQHLTASFVTKAAPYFLEQVQHYEKANQ
jgi:hypothetical protein